MLLVPSVTHTVLLAVLLRVEEVAIITTKAHVGGIAWALVTLERGAVRANTRLLLLYLKCCALTIQHNRATVQHNFI